MLNKTENLVFFQSISPLEEARKTLEGLIAYNKIYRKRVETAKIEELAEIILSTYFNSEILPSVKKNLSEFTKRKSLQNKNIIIAIDSDIRDYERMLKQVNLGNYDSLYLSIYLSRQVWAQSLKYNAPKKTEILLGMLLESPIAKKHCKRISQLILKESTEIPLTAEINTLAKLLKILKPGISPDCIRFVAGISVKWQEVSGKTTIALDSEEQWQLKELSKKLVELIEQKKNKNLTDFTKLVSIISNSGQVDLLKSERSKLGDFSIHLEDEILLAQLYLDYTIAIKATINLGSGDFFEQSLNYYQAMSSIFQLQQRVATFIQKVENRKLEASKVENQKLKEHHQPVENVVVEKIDEIKPQLLTIQEEAPAFPVQTVTISAEIPQIEEEKTDTEEKEERTSDESAEPVKKVVDELESLEAPIEFYKPYYKKQEQKALTPAVSPRNLLKLDGEHLDTYLKVFGLKPCTSIGLRPLMNLLTIHFGGKMGKSKANRCCFKINNIYAYISVPNEPLEKPCNSATIGMHGGGHRATRSQNNDRGTAADYLVEQCRDALTRAGFTPVNLGLEVQITPVTQFKP